MYKLSVNGGLIEFIGEPKIILMANAPGDYSFGKAHKTYYVDIIDSANNRKLLYDNNVHDAILIIDEIQVKGLLYLDEIDNDITKGMFVSGNGKVWEDLRGVKLTDLDFSEYNHILNKTNVDASEAAGGFYKYDLIFRGVPIDATERIRYTNPFLTPSLKYDIVERFPAFNVKGILDKIFEQYDLVDSTDLFEDDMYVLFTKDYEFRNSSEWKEQYTLSNEKAVPQVVTDIEVGDIGLFSADANPVTFVNFPFYVPETGSYRFDYKLPVILQATSRSGATDTADSITIVSTATVTVVSSTRGNLLTRTYTFDAASPTPGVSVDLDIDTRYIECTKAEEINLRLIWTGTYEIPVPPANPGCKATLTIDTGASVRILPRRYYGIGATVEVNELMPDMDVLDFIKGICQEFNISILTNLYTNQVVLWPTDTILGTMDWTDKVLLNKGYTVEKLADKIYRYIVPMDAVGGRELVYEFGSGEYFDVKLLSHSLLVANKYSTNEKLPSIYDPASKTYTTLADNDYSGPEFKTNFGMRLAYETTDFDYDYVLLYTELLGTVTAAPYYSQAKTTIPGFSWDNLYMATQKPYGLNYTVQGLFDRYHRKTAEQNTSGEILNCTLVLDNVDILNMISITDNKDWRSAIHLMGANYKCLELEQLEGNIYKGRFLQIF